MIERETRDGIAVVRLADGENQFDAAFLAMVNAELDSLRATPMPQRRPVTPPPGRRP